MRTPTTIKALEGAIDMLMEIRCGGSFSDAEFNRRLESYKAARDAHHIAEMQAERNRAQFRELSQQVRDRGGYRELSKP